MVAQGGTVVSVVGGDIATIKADALITAINSGGLWLGGIDGVIQRCAGGMFHCEASRFKLVDGMALVAYATGQHSGMFKDVVFVVDDLHKPLRDIVAAGLKKADKAKFKSVTLPTIRMGVMLGAVEKDAAEAAREMAVGIQSVLGTFQNIETVTIVVYNDSAVERLLTELVA